MTMVSVPISACEESVRSSVENTLALFCGEAPDCTGNREVKPEGDCITGILSLVGKKIWAFTLIVPRETAVALAETFSGFEIEFDSDDMGDVIGELVNVIAGGIVAQFESLGIKVDMSLPTVVRGCNLRFPVPEEIEKFWLNFESTQGPFNVLVTTSESSGSHH